jgi:hypothetical protein
MFGGRSIQTVDVRAHLFPGQSSGVRMHTTNRKAPSYDGAFCICPALSLAEVLREG